DLPAAPLGRRGEAPAGGALAQAPGEPQDRRLDLPAGFLARDLRLSLACSEEAQALDGLGYLVEYPHGCIEQTMSRFLPAVMVAHAARRAPVELPPDLVARLPHVLARGPTRRYGFPPPDRSRGC